MGLPRLDFISLKLRVSLGFIFICIILVAGGLFSYLGFSRSKVLSLELTSINEQAKLHSSIEKDVLELQGLVQQFIYQGRKYTENKAYSLSKTLLEDLEIAHKAAKASTAKKAITNTIEHFNLYLHAFGQVVEERELRTLLVEDKLTKYIERSEESILEYIKFGEEKVHVDHISKGYIIMNTILNIEKLTSTYFSTLDSTLVTETKDIFNNIKSTISELIDDENKKREGEEVLILQNIQLLLSKYENGWFMAVQTTRGYLYLVNVVLAGEASEILHNTNRLKKISADDLDIVHKQSSSLIQRYIFFTIIITIVAVTMGIIISWLIAHSVTTPINSLTGVFELLVKGDYSSEIPGLDFKDEIGDLSRAAEVFKDKNIQTELLLKQSNVLTRELEDKRKELAQSNESLEHRVYERTEDLKENNVRLINEIAENKKAQEQIKVSLKEKEVLLAEVHHRVKNNMAVIISLLRMQSRDIKDKHLQDIFMSCESRIKSMALVHEELYKTQDFSNVNYAEYIRTLAKRIFRAYEERSAGISLIINADNMFLGVDKAIPCGLIINEFITNSLKYAFPEAKDGQIAISMCKIEDSCHAEEQAKSQTSDHNSKIELIFHDNGIGIPEDVDIEQAKTMGMSLIRGLTQQLSSTIELDRSNGTEFKIIFKV